jgi:hypothetical protein
MTNAFSFTRLFATAVAAIATGLGHAAVPVCDEACLNGFVDKYLAAVEARDPARAPLAPNVRYTENTRPLKIGDGFWATATKFGQYRNHFADVATQQAGVFAVMSEHDIPGLFTLRIKVANGLITEAEAIVVRKQTMGRFLRTEHTTPKAVWSQMLPAAERLPRAQMIKAVDSYFTALGKGDGNMVPFADTCVRFEHGTQTAGKPIDPPAAPAAAAPGAPPANNEMAAVPRGCRDQFNSGFTKYIQEVDPRRFLVVNEEKGLVFGVFMFRHPGTLTEFDSPGRGKVKVMEAALNPMDVVVAELFKLQDGKITDIEAQMVSLPYRSDTGWDHR